MSTIYTFHQECAALGAVPASDDELLVYDTSTGITKNVTYAQLQGGGGTVTAGTTASAFSNNGITTAQTSAGAFSLTAPDMAGLEKIILFPASTGIRTVTPAGATILGSTISPGGATVCTVTGTSDSVSASLTLVAASTAIWYIKSRSGPVVSS
jgi:hypothetical protein